MEKRKVVEGGGQLPFFPIHFQGDSLHARTAIESIPADDWVE